MVTQMNRLENGARLAMADHRVPPAVPAMPSAPQRRLSLRLIVAAAVAAAAVVLLASLF
jgi:hypothetical protein